MDKPNNTSALTVRTEMQTALSSITERLRKMKDVSESPFKTNGEFRFNPAYTQNSPINIFKCSDLRLLISILSYLTNQSNNYEKAAEILQLKNYPVFEWMNFTYDAWKHDIEVRVAMVTQHDEIKKLRDAKSKLESFMTEEDRLSLVLQELKGII